MPRKLELEALEAELAALTALLAEAKDIDDTVGIMQYKTRSEELTREIECLSIKEIPQANIAMFLAGKPVFGSAGISSDFAGRILENFQEIVSKQYATTELGSLGERGRVPLKTRTTLMLTGMMQGSVGFNLEEISDQNEMLDTPLKEMVEKVANFIESAGSIDETIFETAVEQLDSRTLMALKNFFVTLDTSSAVVRLVDDVKDFSLDEEAVHRARMRTEATEIDEESMDIEGILIGFLPDHRRFEMLSQSGEKIYGTSAKEATEQFMKMLDDKQSPIGEHCVARAIKRTIKPMNRPPRAVYRLLEFMSFSG